jgi:MFS family permease
VARLLADITPLKYSADYRRLWAGLGLANMGTMVTATAVGLEVYDLTQSSASVGLLGAFSLVPVVAFGLYGGAWADAHDRRRISLIASTILWLTTIGIMLQAFAHLGNVWLLYALVAIQGGASSVNGAARSAIIPRLIPPELLPAANALGTMTWTLASLCGPLIGAALVAAIGYGPTYVVDVVTFTAALYALLRLPPMPPLDQEGDDASQDEVKGWRSVIQGLKFLATRRNVLMTFLTDFCAMILAMPRSAFPAIALIILGGGDTTVGVLAAAIAVGTTGASILSGPLGRVRRQGRAVVVSVGLWGLGVAAFGLVLVIAGRTRPDGVVWWALILGGLALAFAGAADSVSAIFRGTILQVATPDELRGRLQGVFIVVVTGGPRVGEFITGVDADWLGEGWAVLAGGLACTVAVAALCRWHPAFLKYDAQHPVP